MSKLYELTSSSYRLPDRVDRDGKLYTREAEAIPTICWPDDSWCLPANLYMLRLYSQGLSRRVGGGTLKTYAANISHLLRFFFKKVALHELCDNDFTLFIKSLTEEKRLAFPERSIRASTSVTAIGRECLEFLSYVGGFYRVENFIGPSGQILGEKKTIVNRRKTGQRIKATYWHHRSFPSDGSLKKRRHAIAGSVIAKLRSAVSTISESRYLRKRRYVLIKLLEITGGRRSEVAGIMVESVRRAAEMDEPKIEVPTMKKKEVQTRLIPISRYDVEFLMEFIEKNRAVLVRRVLGKKPDSGILLLSETTAAPLRPNTITQEIALLSKAAKIVEKTCPHMFRHRFITKLVIALIERHNIENPDAFRQSLLCTEALMREVQQWSGHSSLQSLEHYIDLAFDGLVKLKKTISIVQAQQVITSFRDDLLEISAELVNDADPAAIVKRLLDGISYVREDLDVTLRATE